MRAVAALCALAAFAFGHSVLAQSYPGKPIRWIVTFPPGGPTDVIARTVGAKLTEAWGQQVVIDNRAGAGGVIGTDLAAKSAADGYTLLFGTSAGLSVNPALSSKLPYDPARDFAPVSLLVINSQILVVNNAVPVNSLKELIALVKILAEPEMAQRLASQGAEPRSSTPAELAVFMRDETERWKKVIKSAGIRID